MTDQRTGAVGIIGAGAAGLITAHTLLQDGFTDVQILTRDKSPGGVWAEERVYPGLTINNVHGEFRFSPLPMPPPFKASTTGGRLSGEDMRMYMRSFADRFLKGNIRFETEVRSIKRDETASGWLVNVEDRKTGALEVLKFARIVLCTGGCSNPYVPQTLDPAAANNAQFRGPVLHSSQFGPRLDEVLASADPLQSQTESGSVVVVGGGKSAQDISAYLAGRGLKVSVVFETADAFLATPIPLPDFIRKSRFLGVLSPHIDLHTRLERFLHTTWLGKTIVHGVWNFIAWSSFKALSVPDDSPLHRAHSLFWGIRTNDEGAGRPNGFHALVNAGKIELVAPARAASFGDDGHSLVLSDGRRLAANAVILATGYSSSWSQIFDAKTMEDLGLGRHPPRGKKVDEWDYTTMANPPAAHPEGQQWASSIYRGLVPAKNITRRDFAINGAVFTTNNGYTYEVSAHWISSYFLSDKMRLPSSTEEALVHTERTAAWLRKRFPDMLLWTNESYSSGIAFWTWQQAVDELLEDMELPSMRSGGNWFTWPFKVVDLQEISTLHEERQVKRLVA